MTETEYRVLVEAYAKQHASLGAQLLRFLLGLWIPFTWAQRPDLVNAWAARSAVDVELAVAQARRLSRSFMLEQLRGMDALPPSLPPVQELYPRSGTAAVEVYKRPARQLEHAIRNGATPEVAERVFLDRMEKIVSDDLAAAARDEAAVVLAASPKVTGYRRVLHPELSKSGPCGVCVVAADRPYHKESLLELHKKCKCTVSPITEDHDPGKKLNDADLERIYNAAGSTYMEDLKRIRVKFDEHGELGPILLRDGTEFKGVDRVNAESKRRTYKPYKKPTPQAAQQQQGGMVAASERSIQILEEARRNGTNLVDISGLGRPTHVADIGKAIEYHRSLIALYSKRRAA